MVSPFALKSGTASCVRGLDAWEKGKGSRMLPPLFKAHRQDCLRYSVRQTGRHSYERFDLAQQKPWLNFVFFAPINFGKPSGTDLFHPHF